MWLLPPTRITLDIETIAGDPGEAEEAMRREFAPDARWKPATIGERYLQALEAKKERLALLDTAPIISVALRTECDCRLIHWLELDDPVIAGVPLERADNQREMLWRVREYLAVAGPETVLVGHNIRHFDLPKLRLAMIRDGLSLPPCLAWPEQPTYDTMQMWRYFSLTDKSLISLHECLELAGLVSHKSTISGADVPVLYEKKDFRTLAAYAIADVLAQDALYLAMSGQMGDRPSPVEKTQVLSPPLSEASAETSTVTGENDAEESIERLVHEILDSKGACHDARDFH